MPKATDEFNKKVIELIKNSSPEEIIEILKDEKSLIVAKDQNNNNRVPKE